MNEKLLDIVKCHIHFVAAVLAVMVSANACSANISVTVILHLGISSGREKAFYRLLLPFCGGKTISACIDHPSHAKVWLSKSMRKSLGLSFEIGAWLSTGCMPLQ